LENSDSNITGQEALIRSLALFIGPAVSVLILLFADLDPARPEVAKMAAVAFLMAIWWITEAVPLAATALLPIALYPFLGIMPGKQLAPLYINHIIFLFVGGFIVALAMQKWNLHKRIALRIILFIGVSPRRILFGFMAASYFLSMWISNTATAMMMMPIAIAIIAKLDETMEAPQARKISVALLLGVAYSASIGGFATLIGTPPNLSFARIYSIYFPAAPEITFSGWFAFALPLSLSLFIVVWGLLTLLLCSSKDGILVERRLLEDEYKKLGAPVFEEKIVLALFSMMALLWLTRSGISIGAHEIPGWASLLNMPDYIDDGTVAIAVALLLFVTPSKRSSSGRVMDWESAVKLPWGIVLLFGGGFALAGGFKSSGLDRWIGGQMTGLAGMDPLLLVAIICLTVTFLTEVTSNTATTEMLLPVLAGLSVSIDLNPLLLMVPATLSASCAFMLPVATPPNAIIFGTGRVKIHEMARVGVMINLIGVALISMYVYAVGERFF